MTFDVPASCTLPTPERPVRVAELREMIRAARDVRRPSARHLRLVFAGDQADAASIRDLAARETECCSFFQFTLSRRGETIVLDARVPAEHTDVLDGLARLAG